MIGGRLKTFWGKVGTARARWLGAAALSLGVLAGCSPASLSVSDLPEAEALLRELAACCGETGEGLPEDLVLALEQSSADLPRMLRMARVRKAYLEEAWDAQDAMLARLNPMDIIVNRNGSRLAGGHPFAYFGHAAIYLGTEAQLRALGVWDHPNMRPHQAAIRAGAIAIEATERGVHLSPAEDVFEADTTVILRPRGCDCACSGVAEAVSLVGRRFDYHLSVDDGDPDLICTEVISVALPQLGLPVRDVLGHQVILPDEIVAHALAGRLPLDFVLAIEGFPKGWRLRSSQDVAAMILGAYR